APPCPPAPGRRPARSRPRPRRRPERARGSGDGTSRSPSCFFVYARATEYDSPQRGASATPQPQETSMPARPSFRQALNRAVAEKRLLVVPGAYDALSALLIERAGFDPMFVGGFPVAGARYGVPDIGLKGFADIAAAVRDIIAASAVPVLVDIDDGYG